MSKTVSYAVVSGRDGTVHNVGLRNPLCVSIDEFACSQAILPGEECFAWLGDDVEPKWGMTADDLRAQFRPPDAQFRMG